MLQHTSRRDVAEAIVISLLLTAVVFLTQWRYGFNLGDEGLQWYLSQRVQMGEMPIRDFFGYDPGRYIWSAAWFKLLGSDGLFQQRLANTIFGFVGLASVCLAMAAAGLRRHTRLGAAALLAIAMGYPLHKVYEQSFSLIGIALLAYTLYDPRKLRRWVVLGLITGVAASFGRNSGVYVAVASLLALAATWNLGGREQVFGKWLTYSTAVAVGYTPMIGWFVVDRRFRHAMIDSILFTSKWQLSLPIPFPWKVQQSLSSIYKLQGIAISWLCVAVFLIYAIYGFRLVKELYAKEALDRKRVLGLAALFVGFPFLHQAFDRADFGHIAQGILPIFILAASQLDITGKIGDRAIVAALTGLALLSWLPSEPLLSAAILRHHNPDRITSYTIDGKRYHIESTVAELLGKSRSLADSCNAADGQVVAMPYYPGILAYLHLRSPYWEMYYLYKRDEEFQKHEISDLESHGTKVAVLNTEVAMDGKSSLRIQSTNPILYNYILSNFASLELKNESLAGFRFLTRNCTPAPAS